MIRSWIALVAFFIGVSFSHAAEDLPSPRVVPPPPVPQLPALQMPLPDIGEPAKSIDAKPAETQPAEQPKVVAPSTLLPADAAPKAQAPASAFPSPAATVPLPAPSVIVPGNPNPSGVTPKMTTPSLPNEASPAPATTTSNNVPDDLKWRYKWYQGQWWYWSPDERWMIWDKDAWTIYDAATYKAPAGFAKPGPRVVTQQSTLSVPLPESPSGVEVSTPESYYLTPAPTYLQPTPYAFGVDSYYGPYGPAASYYNRRRGVSVSIGTSPYVPVYESYLAPQYFGPRYTAPVGVYPGYGAPGFYSGRGVSIGFGF